MKPTEHAIFAPGKPSPGEAAGAAAPPSRQVLLGEVCDGARLTVWFGRTAGWIDATDEVAALVATSASRPFTTLSAAGHFAGVFTGIGAAAGSSEIVGGYAGAPPCDKNEAACQQTFGACALALADLGEAGSDDGPAVVGGKACVSADLLLVDIDGDGKPEAFSLDALAGLSDALDARAVPRDPPCSWRFAQALGGGAVLLGVLDLDGDGRRELVVASGGTPGAREQVAIFSAAGSPTHLVRAAARELR
jgi:hypothetical protein